MKAILHNCFYDQLEVDFSKNNIQIKDSYKIREQDRMLDWLDIIRHYAKQHFNYNYKRTNSSWLNEWRAHNKLYEMGVQQHRTADVDLNEDETLIRKIGYSFLSFLYH